MLGKDNNIFLIHKGQNITCGDFQKIVKSQMGYIKSLSPEKIILSGEDAYTFLVNLFSCIYLNIPVILVPDKTRLKHVKDAMYIDKIKNYKEIELTEIDYDYKIEFLTSGSTGTPKLIKKTLNNLISEAEDIKQAFDFTNIDFFMTTSTFTHLFGFTFCLMTPIILNKPINTKRIAFPEEIEEDKVALVATPSFLSKVAKYSLQFQNRPSLIISAGAKLKDNDFEYLKRYSKVIEIYGSTETGVIAHREHFSDDLMVFDNVKIENEKISSPYMYESELELSDTIKFISQNKICVLSRKDRVLKIREERISAVEIENIINSIDLIEESYCFQSSEKLAAVVVLTLKGQEEFIKQGQIKFIKNLKQYLQCKTNVIPQKWKFVDEIPKNKQGKIDKEYMKSLFGTRLTLPLVLCRTKNSVKLVFHRDSNFFKGHFEKYPIVPGVVQLYYAVFYIKELFGIAADTGQLKKIKFSNIIIPDKKIDLNITETENYVLYKYQENDTVYASGQLPKTNILMRNQ